MNDASYKVAMPLDQQTFISNDSLSDGEQLELFGDYKEMDGNLKIAGLEHLPDSAFNALEALKKLLAKTEYKGNTTSEEINTATFGRTTPPRLKIKKSEYFEAYGLKRDSKNRYSGTDTLRRAVRGLLELTNTQHLLIRQKVWTGEGKNRKRLNNILKIHSPLVTIIEGYDLLTDREAEDIESGKIIGKDSELIIELSPVFVLGLDSFFALRRYDKRDTIKALGKSSQLSQKLYRITNWMEQLDMSNVTISIKKLAENVGYNSLVKQRKTTRLTERIEELLTLSQNLGWLLSWSRKSQTLYTLVLNPELCRRIKTKVKNDND